MFVLLKDPRNKVNISYAITTLLTALWATLILLYGGAKTGNEALLWSKMAVAVYAFIPIPFLYFFSVFPREDDTPRTYQLIAWFCVASFFSLISFSDLIIRSISTTKGSLAFIPGSFFVLFVIYFLGFLINAFYRLFERYKAYKGLNRKQIVYVLLGFFLGFIFPVVTNLILPLFGYSLLTRVGPFSTVITVVFISYAITKSHLMDISVVISRFVAEILTVLLLGSIYLGLVWSYRIYISIEINFLFLSWTMLYGVFVGQTHHKLRLLIQTTAEKLFLRGKYNYYTELSNASSHVGEKLSLPNVLKVLYETFHEIVETSSPRVYLPEFFTDPEKRSACYLVYDKYTFLPQKESQKIRLDAPLVADLITKREAVRGVKELNADLIVPCLLEDRLIAIFVLGSKLSEDPYTEEDLRLLKVLASQAAVALDHTRSYEKIRTDLEATEKQLERSQRLAAIGTLTAGVTHEIRNPLTVIRAETERLPKQSRDTAYLKSFHGLLLKHISRIEGVVQRMLNLAKEKPKQEVEFNLNDQLNSILALFKFNGVNLKRETHPLPKTHGDPEELEQVFVNIIQNALEAMPNGGELKIKTYPVGEKAVVEISDTGKGISSKIKERIFDPFFSTRHEGVGLGLSIAYRIIREHGGDVAVTSKEGQGTTFKISL